MRRVLFGLTFGCAVVLAMSTSAWAHSEFVPDEAAPGSIATLKLDVENERTDAATVKVELSFPPDAQIAVVALPPVAGWTGTVTGGSVGGQPAKGVVWSRPTASPGEDPSLPLTLGPLPERTGPLYFNLVQTYGNGEQVFWDQQPLPGIESTLPAISLELKAGAPGLIPSTTSTLAPTSTTTTTAPAPTTTTEASPGDSADDDDSSTLPIALLAALVVAIAGAGAWFLVRRRRTP